MKKLLVLFAIALAMHTEAQNKIADNNFEGFKLRFLDAAWKQYPSYSIMIGYGKYYEDLGIPDKNYFKRVVVFSRSWLDSLKRYPYKDLSETNKISYNIISNQLRSTIWETDTFKIHQWNPALYNLGTECYLLVTGSYAPLEERLKTLSAHIKNADAYYNAAFATLLKPTKEHTQLAILQNEGALFVFESLLTDSLKASGLNAAEKDELQRRTDIAIKAIKDYVAALKKMSTDESYVFRDFRIGNSLFNQKFQYDIVTDQTATGIFSKAIEAKRSYHKKMFSIANDLWTKYCGDLSKPADSLQLIKTVIDKISLNHVAAQHVFDTLNKQIQDLKRFVVVKNLFDFDTSAPIIVRKMPAYSSGVSMASADFPIPYEKKSVAYYNIADFSAMDPGKVEGQLREHNDYILQILSIHEGVPGHCLQGIYNYRKSPDLIKSIFGNGAMAEGWAVYTQLMMLENGWGNNAPEMWLMFYKWSLRECCNVIVDYGIHCLNYSKENIIKLLRDEAFQQEAQINEKYNRATVSQVQLCSYFTGATEILALREDYKKKMGSAYTLKDFHEKFLSYGTAPVKYIRQLMLR